MGCNVCGIEVQAFSEVTSGAAWVLDEEGDDARLAVVLAAAGGCAPVARASSSRTAHRAGWSDRSRAAIVDVDRLFWWLGVFERAPCALGELISVVLVGGYVGRQALDEHDLGVA